MFEVVPVLDIRNSMAVSGQSGRRDNYTPLKTLYSNSSNPVDIANSLKIHGANEIYIADLDLIEKTGHNLDTIKFVNTILPVILDSGIKDLKSFEFFLEFAYKLIIATETIESIEELHKIFDKYPKERIVVSVDIKDNELFSNNLDISLNDLKRELEIINPNEIILLDISSVGTYAGFNRELFNEFSMFKDKIIIGGGVNKDEIPDIKSLGIKKALIGSALHNGDIPLLF